MSRPARVVDLQVREPTPAEAADELRARLYLDSVRRPPHDLWRILKDPGWREYPAADQDECDRLEMELAQLVVRWWQSESFDELADIYGRMLRIYRGLESRAIGRWVRLGRRRELWDP